MDAIMEALGLDFWTFLFQFINILIILAALLFFFWKPIIKMLDSREEKIEGNLKEAASVSYTHLDVYKRQSPDQVRPRYL